MVVKVKVAQLCLTLCDPMDYTVHGILQARILEWVAFPFRGSSQPRDRTQVSSIAGGFLTSRATRRRRQWHPTPVLLPAKSHGRRSLIGYSQWGREELDTTEATSLSLFTFMHWRKKWQPTPVFLPGESQRQGSLVGCRLWGHTKSDTTEAT